MSHHQLPLSLRYLRARLLPLTRPMVWMPLVGLGLLSLFLWESISNPEQLTSETSNPDSGPANTDFTTQLSEENSAIAVEIDSSAVLKSLLNSGNPANSANRGRRNTPNAAQQPGTSTPQQSVPSQPDRANPVPSSATNSEVNLNPYTGVAGLYGVLPPSGELMLPPVENSANKGLSTNLLLNPMQSQTSSASENALRDALEKYGNSDRNANPNVTTEAAKSETAAIAPESPSTADNRPEVPINPEDIQAMPAIPAELPPAEASAYIPTPGEIAPQNADSNSQNAYTYLRETQAVPVVSPPVQQVPSIVTPSISNPNTLEQSQLTPQPFGYPYNEVTPLPAPSSSLNRPGYTSNNATDLNLSPYSSNLGTQVSSPTYSPDMGTQVYSPVYPTNGAAVGGVQTFDPTEDGFSIPNSIPGQYIGGGEIRTFSNP